MNIPEDFAAYMHSLLGEKEYAAFTEALAREPEVSIRLNAAKCYAVSPFACLEKAERVPWSQWGFYLQKRPRFTFDPFMHAGLYYVEEPSSMFLEQAYLCAASGNEPHRLLDLCAAPGGKSALLRSLMPEGTLLVANEIVAKRANVLAENMQKWGNPDTIVTNNPPSDFAPLFGFFDIIVADVPCSGEGMFRKDPAVCNEWSTEVVETCAQRQRQIIKNVWPALCEGGFLIYSTCTFNRRENEDNVRWISNTLGAEIISIPRDKSWGIAGDSAGSGLEVAHFFPHKARGEGFFLALLRKHGTPRRNEHSAASHNGCSNCNEAFAAYRKWLRNADDFCFRRKGADIHAVRKSLAADADTLEKYLHIVYAGIPVATETTGKPAKKHSIHSGKVTSPATAFAALPSLALSTELQRGAFAEQEVEYADAIKYLRGETLTPAPQQAKGSVLITYRGVPLGNVGSRLNNAYPQPWRIRSTYAPAVPPALDF